jgi:hypothetical protein
MKLILMVHLTLLSSCAYHFGHGNQSLPEGSKTVFVEVFENKSKELGAEGFFTQALNRQLERSGFSVVTSADRAEIIFKGSILSVISLDGAPQQEFYNENNGKVGDKLPTTYFRNYALRVLTNLKAVRSRDQKVVWQTDLNGYKDYQGSYLTKQGVRSSNVLYNHSRRKQTMKLLAQEMMKEAFDRLTENF